MKDLYSYNGPVMYFDRCVESHWYAETFAPSEKKARTNLAYRYKKEHNLMGNAKITLPGKLEVN